MATKRRKRTIRSVTLDDGLVAQLKKVGKSLVPKETNLSRLIDKALAEYIERHKAAASRGVFAFEPVKRTVPGLPKGD